MGSARRLVEPALFIAAVLSLSRSIAAVGGFFARPDLVGWIGALLWPAVLIISLFGLSVFQYARLKRKGMIKHPKRIYERLTGSGDGSL